MRVSASFFARGARVAGSLLFAAALVPLAYRLVRAISDAASVNRSVSGEGVDPAQKIRLMAEHISRSAHALGQGAVISSALAWAVFLVAVRSALAVNRKSLPSPPPSARVWLALGTVFLAGVAAIVARVRLHVSFAAVDAFALAGVLSAGLLAACVPTLDALNRSDHDEETGRAWRALLLAAVSLAVSVFLINRAAAFRIVDSLSSVIINETNYSPQSVRYLTALRSEIQTRTIVGVVDTLGCLVVFGSVVGDARARLKLSAQGALATLFVLGMFGLIGLYALKTERGLEALRPPFEAFERASGSVDLPTAPRENQLAIGGHVDRPLVVVNSVGAIVSGSFDAQLLAADRRLTFEALMRLAAPAARNVAFLAAPAVRVESAKLGIYAPLVGSDLRLYPAVLATSAATLDGRWMRAPLDMLPHAALAVLVEGEGARVAAVSRSETPSRRGSVERVSLRSDSVATAERRMVIQRLLTTDAELEVVLVAPEPTANVAHLVTLLDTLRFDDYDLRGRSPIVVLTRDRQGVGRLTGEPGFVERRFTGHLSVESIDRVIQTHLPAIRRCYRKGLRKNPKLQSKYVQTATISVSGKVSSLGSNLGDSDVIDCISTIFYQMAFPAPEGGDVKIEYPIVLSPP